jgi:hypothetical protein
MWGEAMVPLDKIRQFARCWLRGIIFGALVIFFWGLSAIWLRSFWTWDIIEYPHWAIEVSGTKAYEVARYEIRFMSGRGWIGVQVDRTLFGELSWVYPAPREKMKYFLSEVSAGERLSWTTMDDNGTYYGLMNPAFFAWNFHPPLPVNWERERRASPLVGATTTAGVADWLVALILACILAWFSRKWLKGFFGGHAFERERKCNACGYDLRAHKAGERCPECGTEVPGPARVHAFGHRHVHS